MDWQIFSFVIFAALLHASWNALVKHTSNAYISMGAIILGYIPFALIAIILAPFPHRDSWIYLALSVLLHIGYQWCLLLSYRIGDLSFSYPIARGFSPLLTAMISIYYIGIPLSFSELLAICIIFAGIVLLVLSNKQQKAYVQATLLALMTGVFISGYSLIDGIGAQKALTATGFWGYSALINSVVFLASLQRVQPRLYKHIIAENKLRILIGGSCSFCAYAIVVWAFTQAPIALVSAVRETGIMFALLLGVLFLKEKLTIMKLLAVTVTCTGVVVLRLS